MKTNKRRITKVVAARKAKTARTLNPPNKKPSGWDNIKRKRAEMEAAAHAAGITSAAVLIPRIDEIDSVTDWHREIRNLFVGARVGQIPKFEAEFLRKIADSGVAACKEKNAERIEARQLELAERIVERGMMSRDMLPLLFNANKASSDDTVPPRKASAR